MIELVEANWWLFLIALLIGLAVAWLVFVKARRTKVAVEKRDVLDDNAAPAARNQALIDPVPEAAAPVVPPVAAPGLAGAGTAVQAAVHEVSNKAATPAPKPDAVIGDDLTRLKGVGPKLRTLLGELGVVTFAQIAAWTDEDVARIDGQLGRFSGRIERDDWRGQAKLLDAGDTDAYARKFGNI